MFDITLKSTPKPVDSSGWQAFRHCYAFSVEVKPDSDNPDVDPNVIVMYIPDNGLEPSFSVIASLPQMLDIPVGEASVDNVPFFRTSSVSLLASSEAHKSEFMEKILEDIKCLAANIKAAESDLSNGEETTINITP